MAGLLLAEEREVTGRREPTLVPPSVLFGYLSLSQQHHDLKLQSPQLSW